ncbi:hypothetical protein [Hyalangium rubrum]|uniref:Uncharacterized protein n=1 Tax=Hyalangium rubrum TaxID=3103134 RepID=A0ABU5H4B3_9BACT|nr:hypothetical protein [Hyalangium sp. s54d21]MDY7227962.1 hypothetical protein [Hyalangium sp. s54d21]
MRNRWQTAVLVASVLGACGPVSEDTLEAEVVGTAQQEALTGVTLGLNAGPIYANVQQPLSTYSEQIFCEASNLGAKWIRIEADRSDVDVESYQRIVQKAKSKNIKVLVVVPARYCGADTVQAEIDTFTTSFVSHLNDLTTNVFVGAAAVDGFEIGDEVNVQDQGCVSGVNRYPVSPNAFAWLLRRTWEWKTTNARTELIVSGGLRNTYISSSGSDTAATFYTPFFNSLALKNYPGNRPFDYFGIHPYNNANMDYTCINSGSSVCFAGWKSNVTNGLKNIATRVNTATGTTGSKLFATEFGFQLAICTNNNCVRDTNQMTAAMQAAGDAFVNSAVTPIALWNNYRDDANEHFGLRDQWDTAAGLYPVRTTLWNKFRNLAGGTGSTVPEACWVPGEYFNAGFESGDTLRTTQAGDWAYGYYKGECAPGERMMGLSRSTANNWSRVGLCYKDPLDSSRYLHTSCNAVAVDVSPSSSTDWAYGNFKAECGAGKYVAAFAQLPETHDLSYVLCCPATVSGNSCSSVVFAGADNRETLASGDWDSGGFKGECGVGRYVAGVSRTAAGDPHALLCCAQ